MITVAYAVGIYLCTCFVLSALIVRFAPKTTTARLVRKNLALFPFLIFLLLVDLASVFEKLLQYLLVLLRRSFELISGRRLYQRKYRRYSHDLQREARKAPHDGTRQSHDCSQRTPEDKNTRRRDAA